MADHKQSQIDPQVPVRCIELTVDEETYQTLQWMSRTDGETDLPQYVARLISLGVIVRDKQKDGYTELILHNPKTNQQLVSKNKPVLEQLKQHETPAKSMRETIF